MNKIKNEQKQQKRKRVQHTWLLYDVTDYERQRAEYSNVKSLEKEGVGSMETRNFCKAIEDLMQTSEERGMESGFIMSCLEFGIAINEILEKIMKKFDLDEETARKHIEEVRKSTME